MKQPKWLSVALVAAIHDEALHECGGMSGLRDAGLLESAIDRPRNRLAYEPASSLFELAASLCVGLAKNHPFVDGNKRSALLSTCAFLHVNGQSLEPLEHDEVLTLVAVADGSLTESGLSQWLRQNSVRRKK